MSDKLEAENVRHLIREHGHALTPREYDVLSRYYGLDGEHATMAAMAREMGISHTRVRQIRLQAETDLQEMDRDPGRLRGALEDKRQRLMKERDKTLVALVKAQERLADIDIEITGLYNKEGRR